MIMKKRFSAMIVILFALPIVAGCIPYEAEDTVTQGVDLYFEDVIPSDTEKESENTRMLEIIEQVLEPDFSYRQCDARRRLHLTFYSTEELLSGYSATREGRTHSDLSDESIEHVDFMGFNELHLLANLPEGFEVGYINIQDRAWWWIVYAPTDDAIGRRWHGQHIRLQVGRHTPEMVRETWGVDCPLHSRMGWGIDFDESDLIEGRYILREHSEDSYYLYWAEGSTLFMLHIPRVISHEQGGISPFGDGEDFTTEFRIEDMIHLAQTIAIDMQCEANIAEWSEGDFSTVEALLKN
jgi:hypothetical protein